MIDDGCMSLAAHPNKSSFVAGVNYNAQVLRMGDNLNARFFYILHKSIYFSHEHSVQTLASADPDQYQRVARFSKDGKVLELINC
jgi:prolactin regulatory element-binding protein